MSQKLTCHLTDELSGENYKQFLKFAFEYSNYFSISTFKHIRKKDLLDSYYDFLSKVQPYEVDTYKFKQLAEHYERGQTIHTYALNADTKKIIKNTIVGGVYDWMLPALPEDLSFYKGKKVWYNSISHAKISNIVNYDDELLKKLEPFSPVFII